MANGGQDLATEFASQIEDRDLKGRFRITRTSCLGPCEYGPIVLVYPESVMYGNVSVAEVGEIIDQHLLRDQPVDRLRVSEEMW